MFREYVFKYKLFTMPWFYEFKCYAENTENAIAAFIKENHIGIEKYYIYGVFDIK